MLPVTAGIRHTARQQEADSLPSASDLWEFMELIKHGTIVGALDQLKRQPTLATIKDKGGASALHRAVGKRLCDIDIILALLGSGADPDSTDDFGTTPLMCAVNKSDARDSDQNGLRVLLQARPNPNVANNRGMTALMYASNNKYGVAINMLLEAGANPNAADHQHKTVLMYASEQNGVAVDMLLAAGANPNAADLQGKTALMYLASLGFWGRGTETEKEHPMRMLLEAGANPHATDLHGKTALMQAAASNRSRELRMLLAEGVDAKTTDKYGWTALMHAAEHKQSETVLDLQAHYVVHNIPLSAEEREDLNIKGLRILTVAQAYARHRRHCASEADAGPKPTSEDWQAFYRYLLNRDDAALVGLIARRPALATVVPPDTFYKDQALFEAVRNKCGSQVIDALLNAGANIDQRARSNETPLMHALSARNWEAFTTLLRAGADTEVTVHSGQTPLMHAAGHLFDQSNVEALETLLQAGANIEAVDSTRRTALMHAASAHSSNAINVLLRAGAKLEAKDADGSTALMRATVRGAFNPPDGPRCREAIDVLLRAGANLRAIDSKGHTALMWAAQWDNRHAAEALQIGYAVRRMAISDAEQRVLKDKQIRLLTPDQMRARIDAYQAWSQQHVAKDTAVVMVPPARVQQQPSQPPRVTDIAEQLDSALGRIRLLEAENVHLRSAAEMLTADKRTLEQELAKTRHQVGALEAASAEREAYWQQETARWHAENNSLGTQVHALKHLQTTQKQQLAREQANLEGLHIALANTGSQLQEVVKALIALQK